MADENEEKRAPSKSVVKHRFRDRSGSIFKPRREVTDQQQRAIRHDQILISPQQRSLVQIARNADSEVLNVPSNRTVDSTLIFGITGLTGGLIAANLAQPWVYLNTTNDLQRKISSLFPFSDQLEKHHHFMRRTRSPLCNLLTKEKSVEVTKNLFCFTRRSVTLEQICLDGLDASWEHSIDYKGSKMVCSKENLSCEEPFVKRGTTTFFQDASDAPAVTLTIQLQKFTYHLNYDNSRDVHGKTCRHTLMIQLRVNIILIVEEDSQKWPMLLTRIFGKHASKRPLIVEDTEEPILWTAPPLTQISTMVSSLGSKSFEKKKPKISRHFADYELNMLLAHAFCKDKTRGLEKKIVIITSFNNLFLSSTSDYFQSKLMLEQDLVTKVQALDKLVLLRPGPLVGNHTHQLQSPSIIDKPSFIPTAMFKVLKFKKNCIERKLQLLREISQVGIRTKLSELMARLAYQRSCSPLLGHVVPAYKVAFVASIRAVFSPDSASFVELIKSDEIEKMA